MYIMSIVIVITIYKYVWDTHQHNEITSHIKLRLKKVLFKRKLINKITKYA